MTGVPNAWRGVLSHVGGALPPDLTPEPGTGGGVTVNLPLPLVRQSLRADPWWEIPEPVLAEYRRFRPTPLWRAHRFEQAVGSRIPIFVKYEGGNLSGSHKLNTALAQAYYYRQAGVRELVTGTGAGQWGTALAAACARFGLRCTVFMVGSSLRRKPYRKSLMELLGAEVKASPSDDTRTGRETSPRTTNGLALAIGEAVEYAAERPDCAFAIGSGETYSIVHQSVIGLEAHSQLAAVDTTVDAVIACVGAGSNFGGITLPFLAEAVDAGREPPLLLAAESAATPKLTRGVYAYDNTDASRRGPMEAMYTVGSQLPVPDSHVAGLRFHGVSKLLSALRHQDRLAATAVTQQAALEAGRQFAITEAILPAPEAGHALAAATTVTRSGHFGGRTVRGVLVCVSGHGLLDLGAYEQQPYVDPDDSGPTEAQLLASTSTLRPVDAPEPAVWRW